MRLSFSQKCKVKLTKNKFRVKRDPNRVVNAIFVDFVRDKINQKKHLTQIKLNKANKFSKTINKAGQLML